METLQELQRASLIREYLSLEHSVSSTGLHAFSFTSCREDSKEYQVTVDLAFGGEEQVRLELEHKQRG